MNVCERTWTYMKADESPMATHIRHLTILAKSWMLPLLPRLYLSTSLVIPPCLLDASSMHPRRMCLDSSSRFLTQQRYALSAGPEADNTLVLQSPFGTFLDSIAENIPSRDNSVRQVRKSLRPSNKSQTKTFIKNQVVTSNDLHCH